MIKLTHWDFQPHMLLPEDNILTLLFMIKIKMEITDHDEKNLSNEWRCYGSDLTHTHTHTTQIHSFQQDSESEKKSKTWYYRFCYLSIHFGIKHQWCCDVVWDQNQSLLFSSMNKVCLLFAHITACVILGTKGSPLKNFPLGPILTCSCHWHWTWKR